MSAIVVFDTNVIRSLAHGDAALAEFEELAKHASTISFCVGDIVLSELAAALFRGALPFNDWARAAPLLRAVLDPTTPVRREASAISDVAAKLRDPSSELKSLGPYALHIWNIILAATSPESLDYGSHKEAGRTVNVEDYRTMVEDAVESARVGYTSDVLDIAKNLSLFQENFREANRPSQSEIAEILLEAIKDADHRDALDAPIRYLARSVFLAVQPKTPYNPSKHPSDALDFSLTRAVGIPAYVCTVDGRLRDRMKQAQAKHHDRFLDFAELLRRVRTGTLPAL